MEAHDPAFFSVLASRKALFFSKREHIPVELREQQWQDFLTQRESTTDSFAQLPNSDFGIGSRQRSISLQDSVPLKRRKTDYGTPVVIETSRRATNPTRPMGRSASNISYNTQRVARNPNAPPSTSRPSTDTWVDTAAPSYTRHQLNTPRTGPTRNRKQSTTLKPLIISEHDPSEYVKSFQSPLTTGSYQPRSISNTPASPFAQPPSFLSSSQGTTMSHLTSPVEVMTNPTSHDMSRAASNTSSFWRKMDGLQLNPMSRSASSANQSFHSAHSSADLPFNFEETSLGNMPFDASQAVSHMGGAATGPSLMDASKDIPYREHFQKDERQMERTPSSESNSSTTSRLARRSREQAASSNRTIAPLLRTTSPSTITSLDVNCSMPTSQDMSRTSSSTSQPPVAIPKITQSRPIRNKLMCDECNKRPEGYKGDHELRRHKASHHGEIIKVWVCIDASSDKSFLADCDQCKKFKQYKAYYNAAAHLRRKHFRPKPKGEKRNGKIPDDEKRGGKGGGNEPPMSVLKKWMTSFEANADGQPLNPEHEIYYVPSTSDTIADQQPQSNEATHSLDTSEIEAMTAEEMGRHLASSLDNPTVSPAFPQYPSPTHDFASSTTPAFTTATSTAPYYHNMPSIISQPDDPDPIQSYDPTLFGDFTTPFDGNFDFPSFDELS